MDDFKPVSTLVSILILLTSTMTACATPIATAGPRQPVALTVLSYNLWHGMGPSKSGLYRSLETKAHRRAREARQLELLRRLAPDVAVLQECNRALRRGPRLGTAMDAEFFYQPDSVGLKLFGVGLPMNMNGGLVTTIRRDLYPRRVDAISLTHPSYNLVRSWASLQVREERFALLTSITTPDGRRILVVNTHLHDGVDASAELSDALNRLIDDAKPSREVASEVRRRFEHDQRRRWREMNNLLGRIAELEVNYDAVVLAGDFNEAPGGDLTKLLNAKGYGDVWTEAHPDHPGFTFDRIRNVENHALQNDLPATRTIEDVSIEPAAKAAFLQRAAEDERRPRRLDYVWIKARGPARVRGAELVGLPGPDGPVASDHFGVLARIELE